MNVVPPSLKTLADCYATAEAARDQLCGSADPIRIIAAGSPAEMSRDEIDASLLAGDVGDDRVVVIPAMTFPAGEGARVTLNMPTAQAALDAIRGRLRRGAGFTVATLNLDHLVQLRYDGDFRRAYLDATFVVADGHPVVWLSRLAGRRASLAPGSDMIEPICAMAARDGQPVAFFGGSDKTLALAAERLCARHPGLRIVLRRAPPFGFDPLAAEAEPWIREIAQSDARLCFVALGAPKQEIFAARALRAAPHCGFVSIGASLDFIAGAQQRAPLPVRRVALEWLWRAVWDPKRLAPRYLRDAAHLPLFVRDAWTLRRQGVSQP